MARPNRRAALVATLLVVALSATSVAHAATAPAPVTPLPAVPVRAEAPGGLPSTLPSAAEFVAAWEASAPSSAKAAQPDDGLTPAQRLRAHIGEFEALVAQSVERLGIPGYAVGVVADDEVILQRTYGVKQVGTTDPVDEDTLFQAASTSKAFTSAMVATLVDDEVLGWDDPVTQYIPEFAVADAWATQQFTIRDLLAHRSGLPQYATDELGEEFGYSMDEVLRRLPALPPIHPFRTAYAYQNLFVDLAGEAGARALGTTFEDLVRTRIFEPAGIERATVTYDELLAAPNRVSGHKHGDDGYYAVPLVNVSYHLPSGGIGISIRDMMRWLRVQLSGGSIDGHQLVSSTNLGVTHTPHTIMFEDATQFASYGLAWMIHASRGYVTVEHGGDSGVNAAEVWMVPAHGFGMVALSNEDLYGAILRYALGLALNDLAFTGALQGDYVGVLIEYAKAVGAESTSNVPYIPFMPGPNPVPPLALEAYAGTYRHEYYGDVRVVLEGDRLVMHPGDNPTPWGLYAWDGNTFGEDVYNTEVRFTVGDGGTAETLWFGGLLSYPHRPDPLFTRVA